MISVKGRRIQAATIPILNGTFGSLLGFDPFFSFWGAVLHCGGWTFICWGAECRRGSPMENQGHRKRMEPGCTYVYIGKGMALVLPEDRISKDQIDEFVTEIRFIFYSRTRDDDEDALQIGPIPDRVSMTAVHDSGGRAK